MDPYDVLDPQLGDVVEAFDRFRLTPGSSEPPPVPLVPFRPQGGVATENVVVPGDPGVTLRIHRPVDGKAPMPCVFSMHEGAFVHGNASWDDQLLHHWCTTLSVVGMSVEYRLAPGTPYPGPLMDCYVALKWLHAHADEYGIDPSRVGLHGIGAGGGLAAALALVARDHREVPLAFQVLDSPMLDDRQRTHTGRREDLPAWTAASTEAAWRAYLGAALHGAVEVPIYAAASRCTDLGGLPPAFVSVGSLDPLHDEAVDYATRLNHAEIPTELHVYPGAPHGYHHAHDSDVARQSSRDKTHWIRRQTTGRPDQPSTTSQPDQRRSE